MNELKPCPFCGTDNVVLESYKARKGYEAYVQCNGGCMANQHTITYDTLEEAEEKAVKMWNTRTKERGGAMAEYSICRKCFHSYVCEKFNENKNDNNQKCHFANDHFVPAADAVEVKQIEKIRDDLKWWLETNTEKGVVYIPEFIVKNMIKKMTRTQKEI